MTPGEDPRPASPAAAWALALGLGAVALLATVLANLLIVAQLDELTRPVDLLLDSLPYVRGARWLTVVALVLGFGIFLAGVLRHEPWRLPATVSVFAILYLLRAGMTVLTPLAPAQGDQPFIFTPQQYGMFPSGHVAALTLLALLTPSERPWARRVHLVLVVVMAAGLLLARGHYSIDVVGGLLLAYVVAHAWSSGSVLAPVWRVTGR